MASAAGRGRPGDDDRTGPPGAPRSERAARHRRRDHTALSHPTPWTLRARRAGARADATPGSGTPALDATVAAQPGWYDGTATVPTQPGWYDDGSATRSGWYDDATVAAQPRWYDDATAPAQPAWYDDGIAPAQPGWPEEVATQPGWYDDATVAAQPGWYDHATTAAEPGGDDPAEAEAAPSGATPVFVDDSGRRRRWGRIVGVGLGVVVLAYVAVVGLTFAGVQLAGTLAPPGVDDLLEPAGERPAGVGPGAEESPLPPEAFDPDADPAGAATTTDPSSDEADASPTTDQGADASTTAATTTTTVATTSTTAPSPNATVPDHTRPTTANGPPDEPPGKP